MSGHDHREQPESGTHTLEDAGLRCPHCEYNLTGLPEDRCPECGHTFNRALLENLTLPRSILPRELHNPIWKPTPWSVYLGLVYRSLFHPVRTARSLPWVFIPDDAISLSMYSRVYASTVALAVTFIHLFFALAGPVEWTMVPLMMLGIHIWLITLITEVIVAVLLNVITPQYPPGRPYSRSAGTSWFGLIALHSGFHFAMSTAVCMSLLFFLVAGSMDPSGTLLDLLVIVLNACVLIFPLWWWVNICIGVYVRSPSKPKAVIAMVAVPLAPFALTAMLLLFCRLIV